VATLANGDFVVVWSDESDASVRGQRYTAGGAVVGGEFVINTPDFPSNHEQYPQIAALANGGFVVAWDAYYNVTVGDYYNVWAQQFDGAGNKVDGPLLLSDSAAYTQIYPAITGLTGGGFVAAWANTHLDQPGVGDYGVYQRLFGTAGAPERPLSPQLLDLESEVSFAENAVNAAPQLLDPGLRVVEGASPSFDGGVLTVAVLQGYGGGEGYDAEGPGQDVFTILHEGNGAGRLAWPALSSALAGCRWVRWRAARTASPCRCISTRRPRPRSSSRWPSVWPTATSRRPRSLRGWWRWW
jgi:hypothetical protein